MTETPADALTEPGDVGVSEPGPAPLGPGRTVGRYEILERLGSGGMGVVYEARDPRLQRRIALKFILRERAGSKAAQRLRREAVAMARVSHPNVVTVVDVGEHEGDVFVAMELIEGVTLRAWLDDGPRSVEEVHRVFRTAASGLAALHEAGLVHRDFKPDNVMIAGDRVVVMDLGLASVESDDSSASHAEGLHVTATTRVGGVLGTPAFMSPEQFAGRPLDARSDQFSFAVAFYEALVGHRPWPATQVLDLVAALETQPPRRIPSHSKVPARTRRALNRALSYDPADRFESMAEFLRALDARPGRAWGLVVAIVGLAAGALVLVSSPSPSADCDPARALGGAWDETARDAVAEAFEGYDSAYQRERRDVVLAQLDRYATEWSDAYTTACAAQARGEATARPAIDCLEDRAAQLRGVTRALSRARGTTVDAAIASVARLVPVHNCDEASGHDVTPTVRVLQLRATEAIAALHAGVSEPAVSLLQELETAADADAEHVRAQLSASLAENSGDYEAAAEQYTSTFLALRSARRDAEAFETAMKLVRLCSDRLQDPERARRWRRELESLERVRGSDPHERAHYAVAVGAALIVEGDLARANDVLGAAFAEAEQHLGDDVRITADLANHLGWVHNSTKSWDQALAIYERAAALFEVSMGRMHPRRAQALTNIGYVQGMLGHTEASDAAFAEAMQITSSAYGDTSPQMGQLLNFRSLSHADAGNWRAAKQDLEAALRLPGAERLTDARDRLIEIEAHLADAGE